MISPSNWFIYLFSFVFLYPLSSLFSKGIKRGSQQLSYSSLCLFVVAGFFCMVNSAFFVGKQVVIPNYMVSSPIVVIPILDSCQNTDIRDKCGDRVLNAWTENDENE